MAPEPPQIADKPLERMDRAELEAFVRKTDSKLAEMGKVRDDAT